jgi:hypothetical protein
MLLDSLFNQPAHGMTIIKENEIEWLGKHYPNLKINEQRTEVHGDLKFVASYDKTTDQFTPAVYPSQVVSGTVIDGEYKILIKENAKTLPSLKIESDNIPFIPDRHFYDQGSACLCGPVEASQFMEEGFSFPLFIERLVIPFLYGQKSYDINNKWPWLEYAHGSTGILQSYYKSGKTLEHAKVCLQKLQADKIHWPRVKAILSGREKIMESSKCFCSKAKNIRECHLDAWFGIIKLRKVLKESFVSLNTIDTQTNGKTS